MTTYVFKNDIICADKTVFGQMEKYINDFLALLPQSLGNEVDIEKLLDPASIFSEILSAFSASGGRIAAFFSLLMISGVIAYISSVYEGKISPLLGSAVCVVALGPAIYELLSLADEITSALEEICTFFSSLVPLILSVMIAGGSSSASVASGMQMSLVSSALQVLSSELLLPMSRVTLILGGASAFGGYGTERVTKAIRNIFTKGLGLVSTLICALFALQSVIASAADTATLRLAKFTAQSIVPSVGSVITASMSTLSSGLAYARGVIGAGAIGGILWIMISPAAVLMAYRIAISVSLDFALSLGIKPYSRVLSAMQYALDGLISVFIVSGVLFIFQLVIFIKSGVEI